MPIGTSTKVNIRMQQIARMRVMGMKDAVIAAAVGLTPPGLARIVALPEYKDLEEACLQGTVSKMDEALAGKADLMREQWRQAVPVAMRSIMDTVMQKRDLRASLAAAKEILDRDPDRTFVAAKDTSESEAVGAGLSQEQIAALAGHADKAAKETIQ